MLVSDDWARRYTYEVSDGSLKQWSAAKACKSYQRGYDILCRARCSPNDRVRLDLALNFAVCLECVFGAEHAAAFARRAILAVGATAPDADVDAEVSRSLRDLCEYLTNLGLARGQNHRVPRRGDDGESLDLVPGFCTSDASDTEFEEF